MINLARLWWREPDHYEWLTSYLESRGIQRITQVLIAWVVSLQGVLALAMAWSVSGSPDLGPRMTSSLASACCFLMAFLWLARWPTRKQSTTFVVMMTICTSAVCLATAAPQLALLWCTAFVLVTGYVAFYHSARVMTFTVTVAVATLAVRAVSLGMSGENPLLAVCQSLLVINVLLAIPLAIQGVVQFFRFDVGRSDIDPLTNLLNRRAFYSSIGELLECTPPGDVYLAAIMIDLDNFKLLNDTFGHATGDLALVSVANDLRQNTRGDVVCARVGGEEFLIAGLCSVRDAESLADRLREAIAANPYEITASVGLASIRLDALAAEASRRSKLKELIDTADAAMYTAKRAGGNTTHHQPVSG